MTRDILWTAKSTRWGLIELVGFLEEHFAVTIGYAGLTSRNFSTVSTTARPVEERAKAG